MFWVWVLVMSLVLNLSSITKRFFNSSSVIKEFTKPFQFSYFNLSLGSIILIDRCLRCKVLESYEIKYSIFYYSWIINRTSANVILRSVIILVEKYSIPLN
jgi:hypothetical protein